MMKLQVPEGFDHHAPGHHDDAECIWAKMQKMPGLPRGEQYGGFYVVTRHADLRKAAGQHGTFSSAKDIALPNQDRSPHIPAEMDPPVQREYRALLMPFLTAERIAEREEVIRERAITLLDDMADKQHIDFIESFAKPFPILVSLELFGFPTDDAEVLDGIINGIIDNRGTEKGRQASQALTEYLTDFLSRKEADAINPADDLISSIILGHVGGRRLSMEEKVSMTRLLLFGGFTTVMNALSYSVYLFATQPEIVEQLRNGDEHLWNTAVDELVRISSPATYLRRTVTQQTTLGGSELCPGDQVLLCFAAANRDPEVFLLPDAVDLERTPNPHVGFGHGAHRCMGSSVARLEMRVALTEILKRYSRFELNGAVPWDSGETQGIASLPIVLHQRNS